MSNLPPRKSQQRQWAHAPAGQLTIVTLGILLLGGALNRSALAQIVAGQPAINRGFPKEQVVAMHAAVNLQIPPAKSGGGRAVSEQSSTVNSDQGPGGGAIGPGPGCNLF